MATIVFLPLPAHALSLFGFAAGAIESAVATLANMVLKFFAFLLGICAVLLDYSLNLTVVQLSENLKSLTAINETWSTIRDLINLSFIFILLFAAIRTILGLESPVKVIKNIVLAALFINFSMFFTRVMIDASNSVALFFYERITSAIVDTSGLGSAANMLLSERGKTLSALYANPLRLGTLYKAADGTASQVVNSTNIYTIGLMGSMMLALVAFVFLTIAIMFVIRYAALIVLLIFSPLGFISKDLPMIGEYNQQWWGMLKSQLLFPPVFMIMTWITIKVINSPGILGICKDPGDCNFRGALAASGDIPDVSGVGLMINFAVIMALIVMSLLISIQTASKGAEAFSGLYKKASKWAGGAMFGGASLIGRQTFGRGSEMLKNTNMYTKWEAKSKDSMMARLALNTVDQTRTGSMDTRGSKFGKAFAGMTGLDAGEAVGQGGFEADRKAYKEYFARPGSEAKRERDERAAKATAVLDIEAAQDLDPAQIDAIRALVGPRTPDQQEMVDKMDKMEKALARMTDKEVEAIVSSNKKLLDKEAFAQKLSVQQLETINKSDKFSDEEKRVFNDNRFKQISSIIEAAQRTGTPISSTDAKKIAGLTDKELEYVPSDIINNKNFVGALRSSHMDYVKKSTKFTSSQKDAIKNSRQDALLGRVQTTPSEIAKLDPKDVASLFDRGVLTDPIYLEHLNPKKLKSIGKEIDDERKIDQIKAAITAAPGGPAGGPPTGIDRLQTWQGSPDYQNNF